MGPSRFGAILGAWMDGACCEIGVQPENWYWNDAGFRDRPGDAMGICRETNSR